jgi:hypothetical protein
MNRMLQDDLEKARDVLAAPVGIDSHICTRNARRLDPWTDRL